MRRHAHTAPVRHIHYVNIAHGRVDIQLTKEDPVIVTAAPFEEADLETLFRRVNNAFIHRFKLSFRLENLPLPYYLRANAERLQCKARSLHIKDSEKGIDYALVDFLGVHLQPQIYELFEDDPDEAFTAPLCIIPELFGVGVVETCAIKTNDDPYPWLVKFVEMFKTAESKTAIVRRVTLLHTRTCSRPWRLGNYLSPPPPSLGEPRHVGVPTPHSTFIKNWMRTENDEIVTTTESAVSDLFVYENSKAAKKLEIFTWTVVQIDWRDWDFVNPVFLLRVVDM